MGSSLNGHAPSTNGVKHEDHAPQCRGLWIPIAIWNQFEKGEISSTEVLLLSYIDSLVRVGGEGCWATNKHLAKKFNVTPNHLGTLINHLEELDLIIQVGWKITKTGRFRLLETSWSRVGEGGIKENHEGVSRKTMRGGIKENHDDMNIEEDNVKEGGPPRLNGFKEEGRNAESPEDLAAAEKLKESLRTSNRRVEGWNPAGWSETFRLLREKDKQEYGPVLDWFCLNCCRDKQDQLKLPSICNAKQFRKHFEWISDVMRKNTKKCPYPTIKIGAVIYAKVPTIDGHAEIPLDELPRYLRNQNRVGSRYEG